LNESLLRGRLAPKRALAVVEVVGSQDVKIDDCPEMKFGAPIRRMVQQHE